MGGPLVVGTIAYGVTGGMLIWRKRRQRAALTAAASPRRAGTAAPDGAGPDGSGPDRSGGLGGGSLALATDDRGDHPAGGDPAGDDLAGATAVSTRRGWPATRPGSSRSSWSRSGSAWSPSPSSRGSASLFFAVYALYFRREMSAGGEQASDEGLEPLKLQRYRARPSTAAVVAQTLATLAVIFVASQLFVQQLEWAGPALGLPSAVVALLLSPVATELPEIMNAIIWVRQGKIQLALANISGAMMIQATVPSGIGLLFTAVEVRHPAACSPAWPRWPRSSTCCASCGPRRLTAGRLRGGDRFLRRLRGRSRAHALSPGPDSGSPAHPRRGTRAVLGDEQIGLAT